MTSSFLSGGIEVLEFGEITDFRVDRQSFDDNVCDFNLFVVFSLHLFLDFLIISITVFLKCLKFCQR